MNFPTDHIERIKEFGYTESEARFLYIVAVHSGYFTLGQFRAFTGTAYGKRPTSFAQKALKRGHATIRDYMCRGSIFHLFSRTIFAFLRCSLCGHPELRGFRLRNIVPFRFASRGLPGALSAAQEFPVSLCRREGRLFSKGRRAFPFPGKEAPRIRRLGRDPPLLPSAQEVGAPRVCRARYRGL